MYDGLPVSVFLNLLYYRSLAFVVLVDGRQVVGATEDFVVVHESGRVVAEHYFQQALPSIAELTPFNFDRYNLQVPQSLLSIALV